MNYKKEIYDNYTLHLIKTDKFKTVDVSVRLTKPFDKNEFAYLRLLEKMIRFNTTKKYKNITEISKELERLYNSNLMVKSYAQSKNMIFECGITMVNPKYTELNVYDGLFDLFEEIMFNQKISDNKFSEELFEIQKNSLIKNIENIKDEPQDYAALLFEEIFFKNTVYAENNLKNIDIFNNITNEGLSSIYRNLFKSNKVDILVIGDFDEDIIKSKVKHFTSNIIQNDVSIRDLNIKIKEREEKCYTKQIDTNQSNLLIGCTIKDITEEEKNYKLILYNTILGCMNNSVLFVNVRELNSLCYHIGSIINKYTSTIIIESGINAKNFSLAHTLITKCLEDMCNEETIKPLIKNAKKTLELAFNDFYDNKTKIMNYYYMNEFDYTPSIEERRKKVSECTIEDIINLAKKVKIKDVFLLEGVNNEED